MVLKWSYLQIKGRLRALNGLYRAVSYRDKVVNTFVFFLMKCLSETTFQGSVPKQITKSSFSLSPPFPELTLLFALVVGSCLN